MKSVMVLISLLILSRAPQGARGLKFKVLKVIQILPPSRAPQGARGLKYKRKLSN